MICERLTGELVSAAADGELFYLNEFHIKHQGRKWRDNTHIPVAIANGRRNDQGGFSSLFHHSYSLIPALDYLAPAKHEFDRILTFERRIKYFPVQQLTG